MHEDTLNVAGSRGYIWFMALNIVFCLWLIVRSISPDVKNLVTTDLNFYYFSILAISTLVVTVNNIVKNKKKHMLPVVYHGDYITWDIMVRSVL